MFDTDNICEQGVLGAILFDKKNIDKVKFILKPSDFVNDFFKNMYVAMLILDERGEAFNLTTLAQCMKTTYPNDNIFDTLVEFSKNARMNCDVMHYAGIVIEARKRKDYDAFLDAQKMYNAAKKPLHELLESNINFVDSLFKDMKFARGYELAEAWYAFLEAKEKETEGYKPFKILTGFPEVDRILEGFREGNLITIAAESGGGKTTFGLNVLKNVIINHKIPVLLLSLEMNMIELAVSTLASHTKLSQSFLKRQLSDTSDPKNSKDADDYEKILSMAMAATTKIHGTSFCIYHENIDQIQSAIRTIRMHLKKVPTCKVVMVDYIGLMNTGDAHKDSRVQQVTFMTKALKNLAMELNIVIIMLAQLNRDNKEHRRPPSLSDLRESGSIAFDSNVVIFIEQLETNARIHVAKNRSGPRGNTLIGFNGATGSFESLVPQYD